MKTRFYTLLCCGLLLGGCQLLPGTPDNAPGKRLQGELGYIDGQWQLTTCDGGSLLPLEFAEPWLQAAASCDAEQGQSCFADLEVRPTGQVTRVHRIQHEGHGCADDEFGHLLIRAAGNEPFWSVRLNSHGLVLQQPGQPAIALPYIHEQLGDGLQYISSQADHHVLQLWISPQPCIDSMSGAWHALSARLQWQGETFTGCAYHGAQQTSSP